MRYNPMDPLLRSLCWLCALLLLFTAGCSPAFARASALPASAKLGAEPLPQSQIERCTLASAAMQMNVPFMVYLPKGYTVDSAYPVWYGLHGYSSSEKFWLSTAGIGNMADTLIAQGRIRPLIMVFPLTRYDSAKVIQADMRDGRRGASQMERFLCEELIPYVNAHYATLQTVDCCSIGGFSMGGLFALQIALHNPGLFTYVSAYSPALTFSDFTDEHFDQWLNIDKSSDETAPSAFGVTQRGIASLRIYLDYGTGNDPFAQGVQSLSDALQTRGVSVTLRSHEGGHSLQLNRLAEYLLFFDAITPKPESVTP